MSLRLACALLSVSVLGTGCSVYQIRGRDRRPIDGVPFFPHVGVCRQETSYIQPVYRLAVQVVSGNRVIVLYEASVTATAVGSPEFGELRSEVMAEDADPVRIGRAFDALTRPSTHQYDPLAQPAGLFLAGNSFAAESQVDYGNPLFMNVSRPWIGSAAASARLAANGTLAEANAEVKDATGDTVLSAVPAKELLTALATGERVRALLGVPGTAAPLQLAIEPQFVKHTYTTLAPAPCPAALPPIDVGAPGAMYRREQLAGANLATPAAGR
jgi:hypothetical protein